MNYIERAKIAQRILTAAPGVNVTGVHLYGYVNTVQIHTSGPIPGYEYAPEFEGGHPTHRFWRDDVTVELIYVEDKEAAA